VGEQLKARKRHRQSPIKSTRDTMVPYWDSIPPLSQRGTKRDCPPLNQRGTRRDGGMEAEDTESTDKKMTRSAKHILSQAASVQEEHLAAQNRGLLIEQSYHPAQRLARIHWVSHDSG
jgi:hypothetical protein